MYVCFIEENIQQTDVDHIFEFPNLRKRIQTVSSKKSHILKVESRSSRECQLEFFNIETGNELSLNLKFNHIHDCYKIELDDIFDEDNFFFRIKNKAHVFLSCTRMFQKRTKELIYKKNEKKNEKKDEQINEKRNEQANKNDLDEKHFLVNGKHDRNEMNGKHGMQDMNGKNDTNETRKVGILFFTIAIMWKYYSIPFFFNKVKDVTETRTLERKSFSYQDPFKIFTFEFLPIFATFLVDYKPSFQFGTCDEWLSHVINSSIRAFNAEYGLSIPDDFNVTEFLDSITPQLYKSDKSQKSEGNKLLCSVLNYKEKECAYFLREGYLYLLGDDESAPFKPIQDLIQKIKFLQQHVKDILIAVFKSYYKHGLINF